MSTLIATPSNTLAKVRWHEQYVSEGLNKKLNGITPAGVIRGGKLVENLAVDLTVKIQADPIKADSIYSSIDANGHQLTFRQAGDVTLDLTPVAGTTVFIGLIITYAVSATTQALWRAYSQAEIDADPTVVVLGRVVVPGAGAIPAANITPMERRDAWYDNAPGMRDWHQVIDSGGFEVAAPGVLSNSNETEFPGWRNWAVVGASVALEIDQVNPLTGLNCLKVTGDGTNAGTTLLYQGEYIAVRPGTKIKAAWWVRGIAVSAGGMGVTGRLAIRITYLTHDLVTISTVYLCDVGQEDGTFAYTEFDEVTEAPATAAYAYIGISAFDSAGTMTGSYYIDDMRVWVEAGKPATDDLMDQVPVNHEMPLVEMDIAPWGGVIASMADYVAKVLRLRYTGFVSSIHNYEWKHRAGSLDWLLKLIGGGLQIDRLITDIGGNLIGSAANAALARITTKHPAAGTAEYVLLWEMRDQDTRGHIRLYASSSSGLSGSFETLSITLNAHWTGTQWERDVGGRSSSRFDFGMRAFYFYLYESGEASPWNDTDWDSPGHELAYLLGNVSSNRAELELKDAQLRFMDISSSNPSYGSGAIANTIYAKSMIKAWGYFETDGAGGFTARNGVNALMTLTGGGFVTVTFSAPMSVPEYAVIPTIIPTAVPVNADWNSALRAYAQAVGSFRLYFVDITTGLWRNPDTGVFKGSFVVLGEQA